MSIKVVQQKNLHNTLSDCAYLFKNLRFLTVTVSEIVEQLKSTYICSTDQHMVRRPELCSCWTSVLGQFAGRDPPATQ